MLKLKIDDPLDAVAGIGNISHFLKFHFKKLHNFVLITTKIICFQCTGLEDFWEFSALPFSAERTALSSMETKLQER